MTKYLWVDSIAEKWGVSKSWVYRLCREGRVSGAFFSEGRWSIPEDAEKPIDYRVHKRYIKALTSSKRAYLPEILPLKLTGESDRIPDDVERVVSECAEYVLDLVDVHPGSGKLLFCALSYAHMRVIAVCENYFEYCYLSALKKEPEQLYELYSMMCFEYSMLTPDMRKGYFNEKRKRYNKRLATDTENAALILFMAGALGQRTLNIDTESGDVCSVYKKRDSFPFSSKEDIFALSKLLERAVIYESADSARQELSFSEYSALHLSEIQYSEGLFEDITEKVERLMII